MIGSKSTIIWALAILWMFWGTHQAIAQGKSGFRTLNGAQASQFILPNDVQLVKSFRLDAHGLTYERYQQFYRDAKVLGGQLTLHWNDSGELKTVIGAHYPNIVPKNFVRLGKADARGIADRDIGPDGNRFVNLMINPKTGRYFYRVETRRMNSRWIHWVGAQSGRIINKFDSLMNDCGPLPTPCGHGAHYRFGKTDDIKNLMGQTMDSGSSHLLKSAITETHDQGSTNRPFLGPIATDSDDDWVLSGRTSPGQGALVDAHYYASVTDNYFLATHGFDFKNHVSTIEIHAHWFKDYANAFWNGDYAAFGDGDGISFNELTSLDVVGHELTHAVTEFTSNLVYQDEAGALNESFSDIMGNTLEHYASDHSLEPSVSLTPDWLVGEDFDIRPGENGFRNMGDPEEDGDPDHYSERYTGTGDNGGVHINSGIPNHAYYLLVNGGQNASCTNPNHNDAHCVGVGLTNVNAISQADAEKIFFLAFTSLNTTADMCAARNATEVKAISEFGQNSQQHDSTLQAWDAVGVTCDSNTVTNNPPDVTITSPLDGDDVSGNTVTITADASDSDGSVTQVEFFVNDVSLGVDSDGSNGWSSPWWDTTSIEDGGYTLEAVATDDDTDTNSHIISVIVNNNPDSICRLAQVGESCVSDSDCCSNKCRGKLGQKFCR